MKALASICSSNYKNQEIIRLHDSGLDAIIGSVVLANTDPEIGEQIGESLALVLWCLTVGNSRMQTSIREKNGLQPIVNLIVNNLENAPILLNGLGAAYALSLKCNPNRLFFKDKLTETVKQLENNEVEAVASQAKQLITLLK